MRNIKKNDGEMNNSNLPPQSIENSKLTLKLNELLINNWLSVYDCCKSVEESKNKIMSVLEPNEQNLVLENWVVFSELIDDSYNYGLTCEQSKTQIFRSMLGDDLEVREFESELIDMILEHILGEMKMGLPYHESWESIYEGDEIVEFGMSKLNLSKDDIIGEYFDKSLSLFEIIHSDIINECVY